MPDRLLYNELRREKPSLADELDVICKEALDIWKEQYLRPLTAHGQPHIEQVEDNLDSLTRPLQRSSNPLQAEEIFVLIAACYLHDIGMQLDEPDARARHAEYAYELILYSSAQVGTEERLVTLTITDNNAREAIAEVAKAHWTQFALELKAEDFIFGIQEGRLRLLGSLLAMADLLDISPVRARYYRTLHRLSKLNSVSELDQTMHALVRGFRIIAPNPAIGGDLQFQLEWRDNSRTVQLMHDWVIQWFTSQWRQLQPLLYQESSGAIRWTDPWTSRKFNPPKGPIPTLSKEALHVLQAERAEQVRINRDEFVNRFKEALAEGGTHLFRYPSDSDSDSRWIAQWCETYARIQKNDLVANVYFDGKTVSDFPSIISELTEQWGEHLPSITNHEEALEHLRSFMSSASDRSIFTIIVTRAYRKKILEPLLKILLQRPKANAQVGRICLLMTRNAEGPNKWPHASVAAFDGSAFSEDDVVLHLQDRWGYSETESKETYSKMAQVGLAKKPGHVYNYVETHCGLS